MKRVNFLLVVIILLAATLRLWGLGSTPPSPDWDEAALAYNAYSIMQTGKDEYGKFMPVVLQSFDDYKPALYTYLSIPTVAIFGLSTFAVRLPSAIFGILTVLAAYFLVQELFGKRSKAQSSKHVEALSLLTSFLLAISPWHIQLSRVAFETNVGLACNIFGTFFFLKGLRKPLWLFMSILCFAGSLYVYQSEKVFVPLLGLALVIIWRRDLFSFPKKYLTSLFLFGIVLLIPMLYFIATDKNALLRAKGVSIFSESAVVLKSSLVKTLDDENAHNPLGQLFHNRRLVYATEMASGYLSHYDLNWLFVQGDLMRHHPPNMGMLYLWELPFLLLGIYFLIFGHFPIKTKVLIFGWFLLAPVPASITTGVPHAVRTLNFLPTFQIFTAIGLVTVYMSVIKSSLHKVIKWSIISCFLLFASFNFVYYLDQYFAQQNYFSSKEWQYGYEQIMPELKAVEGKYSKIVVSSASPLDQSHMFFLFYLKYPPALYQHEGNLSSGFRENHRFGKFEFRPIDWKNEEKNPSILYIGKPEDFPVGVNGVIKEVNYLDGEPAIRLVEG